MTEYIAAFTAIIVAGVVLGIHIWHLERRARTAEAKLVSVLENLAIYGRADKPKATVFDPGPVDDESRAQLEIRTRAIDRLAAYLMEEGQVSDTRAREEAERLVSSFETRGQAF